MSLGFHPAQIGAPGERGGSRVIYAGLRSKRLENTTARANRLRGFMANLTGRAETAIGVWSGCHLGIDFRIIAVISFPHDDPFGMAWADRIC